MNFQQNFGFFFNVLLKVSNSRGFLFGKSHNSLAFWQFIDPNSAQNLGQTNNPNKAELCATLIFWYWRGSKC